MYYRFCLNTCNFLTHYPDLHTKLEYLKFIKYKTAHFRSYTDLIIILYFRKKISYSLFKLKWAYEFYRFNIFECILLSAMTSIVKKLSDKKNNTYHIKIDFQLL